MLVGVSDPAVVLFLEGVFRRIRIGIAPLPEGLDELLALFVGREVQEGVALFGSDDVHHILIEPVLVLRLEFLLQFAIALLLELFLALLLSMFLRLVLRPILRLIG